MSAARRVDLDRKTITIRGTRSRCAPTLVEGDTKTDTSARNVSLDAGTLEVLCSHRRRQAELRLLLGSAWVETGLMFAEADGAARPGQRSQRFDRLVIHAGLPPVRPVRPIRQACSACRDTPHCCAAADASCPSAITASTAR